VPSDGATGADVDASHLDDVDDGCGCAEVWEELSEQRQGSD
jgi:hypothetical protein